MLQTKSSRGAIRGSFRSFASAAGLTRLLGFDLSCPECDRGHTSLRRGSRGPRRTRGRTRWRAWPLTLSTGRKSRCASSLAGKSTHDGRRNRRTTDSAFERRTFSTRLKIALFGERTVTSNSGNYSDNTKGALCRAFRGADDGTRTHDLLHGKQTL